MSAANLPLGRQEPTIGGEEGEEKNNVNFDFLWDEYNKQVQKQKERQANSLEIFPEPGFVLKTWTAKGGAPLRKDGKDFEAAGAPSPVSGAAAAAAAAGAGPDAPAAGSFRSFWNPTGRVKVFVNICSEPALPHASNVPGLKKGDPPRLRVPVSCGPPRKGVDNQGNECLVYDAVFNPDVVQSCEANKEFRTFVCQFACDNLKIKYNTAFSGEFKFPRMLYKHGEDANQSGNRPPSQFIRKSAAAKKKLVQEIDVSAMENPKATKAPASSAGKLPAQIAQVSGSSVDRSAGADNKENATPRVVDGTESSKNANSSVGILSQSSVQSDNPASVAAAAAASNSTCSSVAVSDSAPSESNAGNASASPSSEANPNGPVTPEFELKTLDETGTEVTIPEFVVDDAKDENLPSFVEVRVLLPAVGSASELDLQLSSIDVVIQSTDEADHNYFLFVDMPFRVDQNQPVVKFSRKRKRLRLRLNVTGRKNLLNQDSRRKPKDPNARDWKTEIGLSNRLMFDLCPLSSY